MADAIGLFDESFYLSNNLDVARAVASDAFSSGFDHFNRFGKFEGRNPSALFNTKFYLQQYNDIAIAFEKKQINPYDHFQEFGRFEGRDPSVFFNTRTYLEQNLDVAIAVSKKDITGFDHFLNYGINEGRGSSQPYQLLETFLVGNTNGNNVLRYNTKTGAFLGEFIPAGRGGLFAPDQLLYGPDGNGDGISDLYISSGNKPANSGQPGASAILRYDGLTGEFIDVFVGDNPNTPNVDESGGLIRPYGSAFGPDGILYVSSFLSDQILCYNATTGQFVGVFASGNQQPGGLNGPNGLFATPDGSLYVTTEGSVARNGTADFSDGLPSQVLRYNIYNAQSTVFATASPLPENPGFTSLLGIAISPQNGNLYVSDFANYIRSYDLNTGSLLNAISTNYTGTSPTSNFIGSLAFAPDGNLFTVGFDNRDGSNNIGAILRYDGTTGQPLPLPGNSSSIFVAPDSKLARPIGITFFPA